MEAYNQHTNQLLERCKNGDQNAQMQLYKDYYKAMYNTAHRILRDEFEAEDIMQESFLTAFTKLNTFKGEVAFGAWLKRIVINKSLTQLKKNNKYNEIKLEVIPNREIEEESINYSLLNVSQVQEKMNSLKDNYRMVLNLNLIEGFDYEEIAQILNYTNENVRTTISRAKKKLKQLIIAETNKTQVYGR
ncbi:RNA polymerase sigma-70 factor (ECF subfamily) [Lutibacter sp. Hel_I_33_5]|uniref:RNA polymerase sigma factor n=1 Tax=Lutibacter sp. Hel_I_33_5 TaxID=1566289 RepID=UPI0011A3EC17|nr:sigma-70 family RNA polymerase sigma factor [Lutibacter sp. Hel_I_33_5]TVZ55389.1 RNA polymerase sigma-70 factor (ECF subfamily) [Lutibacter sp. Hel_I_33_5]